MDAGTDTLADEGARSRPCAGAGRTEAGGQPAEGRAEASAQS